MDERTKIYIGGAWVSPRSSGVIQVHDSSDGQMIGSVPAATASDVDAAVRAARAAFDGWSGLAARERASTCERVAKGLETQAGELAGLVTRETGMPEWLSRRIQVGLPITSFRTAADVARSFRHEETIGNSLIMHEPVGVVGCITPWNYPLHQIAAKVAYAMAAGCTVVVKPSAAAPLDAFMLAGIIDEAGVPAGVFNLVSGTGTEVGEAIATHPGIDMVSFTGSTQAGQRVAELAARSAKRLALELGGKSANILLPDLSADEFDRAIRDGVGKCFLNSGQTCSALTRMLVPRSRLADAEEITKAEVEQKFQPADPFAERARLGPLASRSQAELVTGYVRKGIEEGATLVTGGPEPPEGVNPQGYFVRPTVFSNVRNEMTIAQEEIFGPVLSIIPFDTDDEAVAIANDSPYGLAGGVWSADEEHAKAVARRIRTGQIEINGGAFNPSAPFGGYKQSGYGRECGSYGFAEFLQVKSLQF